MVDFVIFGSIYFFKYDAIVNNQEFNLSSNKVNVSVDNTFVLPKQFKINVFAFMIHRI